MRMKRAEEEQYKKNLASALLKYKDCVSRLDVPKPEWFIKTFKLIRRGQYISNKRWHSIVGSNAETISYKQSIKKRNSYIIEELKSGINKDEITKKYNITHKQLSALIRKKSPPSKASLKLADTVCNLYLEGSSVSNIKEIKGISEPTIIKLLDTKNIYRRSQSETSIQHHALRTDYFEEIDTVEKAWILGLIYADGSLNKRNSLQVSQSKENESLLRIIAEELNYPAKFTSSSKSHTEKKQSVLTITRQKIFQDLLSLGMTQDKENHLGFPFSTIKPNFYWAFLSGFYNGDGGLTVGLKKTLASKQSRQGGSLRLVGK